MRIDRANSALLIVGHESTVNRDSSARTPVLYPWLVLIDAALGQKEEALYGGRRAVELLPVEKEPTDGKRMIVDLARIAAWVGDNDLACEELDVAIRRPSELSYGQLKLYPWWDSLRGAPCFEKIVASLAPKSN